MASGMAGVWGSKVACSESHRCLCMCPQTLVDAKTVSITHLLAISPPGTLDPTPMLYDSTMYVPRCALLWRTCVYVPTSLVLRAYDIEPAFVTQWHCCLRSPAIPCPHVSIGPCPFFPWTGMGWVACSPSPSCATLPSGPWTPNTTSWTLSPSTLPAPAPAPPPPTPTTRARKLLTRISSSTVFHFKMYRLHLPRYPQCAAVPDFRCVKKKSMGCGSSSGPAAAPAGRGPPAGGAGAGAPNTSAHANTPEAKALLKGGCGAPGRRLTKHRGVVCRLAVPVSDCSTLLTEWGQ